MPYSLISVLQAKEDEDKPGLVAMLQKVMQLYASCVLSKRSYAKKGKIHPHLPKHYKFLLYYIER